MRLSFKMYLVVVVGASLVVYQYHLAKTWTYSAAAELISANFPLSEEKSQTSPAPTQETTTAQLLPCKDSPQTSVLPSETLYIITPTYKRPEQLAELTRLSHTLMLVPNIHWLVIEDSTEPTLFITEFLKKTGLSFSHLTAPMPEKFKNKKGPKPRGVSNRNKGLEWVRMNASSGVVYFADDDNTYDLELFEEIRRTQKVSMLPVGLITSLGVSSPIVKNGTLVGFYDGWVAGRKFPVDMAGFAVSVKFLSERPNASMPFKPGYEEDGFLKSLAPLEPSDIELLAENCTKILAWHTQSKKNNPSAPLDISKYNNTNIVLLKKIIV